MKATWEPKTLGEICSFENGDRGVNYPSRSARTDAGIPFINAGHLTDTGIDLAGLDYIPRERFDLLGSGKIRKGDILFCLRGSLGKFSSVGGLSEGVIASSLVIVRPKESVLNEFVLAYLQSDLCAEMINRFKNGAAQPNLSAHSLSRFVIPLPPVHEQRQIVDFLDEAFDSIATARANAEKNLQNARALFEGHLQSVFARRGDCPVVPIGDISEVFDGPHATPKTVDVGPVFLGISALQDGEINLSETRHVTPGDFQKWTRRVKPQTDDVVFSYETRLGQAAIIPEGLECCLGRRMGLVRVDRKRLDPRFFVYQYISPPFRDFLDSQTVRGATVDRIALKEFPSFPINLPSLAEQKRIANRIATLRKETECLESLYQRKCAALDALKRSLLHQAFTGQL